MSITPNLNPIADGLSIGASVKYVNIKLLCIYSKLNQPGKLS